MPEAFEIWALSQLINQAKCNDIVKTYPVGKELYIWYSNGSAEIWSFGLTGQVFLNEMGNLEKLGKGWINGKKQKYSGTLQEMFNKQKQSILFISFENLANTIHNISTMKKMLGPTLIEQHDNLLGIGVAWGSEICHQAKLNPAKRCCDQDLSLLIDTIIDIRNKVITLYASFINNSTTDATAHANAINNWFYNLYAIRSMKVYKQGTKIEVNKRNWWI